MTSINLTIHNKGFLLPEVLSSIKAKTVGNYELVAILDGCTDNSEQIIEQFKKDNSDIPIKIIHTPDVFETKANNVAMKASSGDQIIIVQDDMIIDEHGWNERLLTPFRLFSDTFAVTARCAHNWVVNPSPSEYTGSSWSEVLSHVDHADKNNTPRHVFAIRDSVNRGPLAIDHQKAQKLGYLDEVFAPLDGDEHDLMYRSKKFGWVCGFYHIDWHSSPEWGGTRNQDGTTKKWVLDANHKNSLILAERHGQIMTKRTIENRNT